MAASKIYVVKKGRKTGIFRTWDECRAAVDGYSGAKYKGFSSIQEAENYLSMAGKEQNTLPTEKKLLTYVDGSYDDSVGKYAFGCVFILPDGRVYTRYGNGNNEQSLQHRNVTGEMLGAMYAVRTAIKNQFSQVEVCYDYQGIEKWVTGEWRAKTELTQKYTKAMREWGKQICISFTKVTAHTNVEYNELADRMAKAGLREGNGIPQICYLEELDEYCGGIK